jgi:hypothetical protein
MAKYHFACKECHNEEIRYVTSTVLELVCDKCGNQMVRKLPESSSTQVNEVVDQLTNRKWQANHEEMIKDRRDQHYWDVEVPRLVQTHSIETCLEQGWLTYNEKGELVVNKPPSKR